ncbi:MAG: nickel pincer cofactor biosynthesis protein LarB [Candidatus Glassbacteria bacterium]
MHPDRIREILTGVEKGEITAGEAMELLKTLPFEELGFAMVDHHRQLRTGFPEVIFCEGKSADQVASIAGRIIENGQSLIATRAGKGDYEAVAAIHPQAEYFEQAGIIAVRAGRALEMRGHIAVVCAGTSDLRVAEEAAVTAELLGSRVERFYDVGVAGLHRVLSRREDLLEATVVIVVAGMDGALASVVGGLVDRPVIAVPTSIGYGANFGGLSALLTMLNSCAAGVTVVNIDNGFGAAYAASMINRAT